MGGTFDPIHYGHLVTAEEVRMRFGLDEVIFVPAGRPPPPKANPVTLAEHRFLMVVLATASNPYFRADRLEIDRNGPSYTVDTLEALRHSLGENVRLSFITGADAILEILTWRNPDRLLQLARFVAATRPGFNLEELRGKLTTRQLANIDFVQVPGLEISSTAIRERVAAGLPIRYLTPPSTEAYIKKYRLYAGCTSAGDP